MKTLDDLKAKLAEIKAAEKAVEDAKDALERTAEGLYYKVREVVGNVVERSYCNRIRRVELADDGTLEVYYTYYCRGDEGPDSCRIPAEYLLMEEDEYLAAEEERRKRLDEENRARRLAEAEKAERETLARLKEKYEGKG